MTNDTPSTTIRQAADTSAPSLEDIQGVISGSEEFVTQVQDYKLARKTMAISESQDRQDDAEQQRQDRQSEAEQFANLFLSLNERLARLAQFTIGNRHSIDEFRLILDEVRRKVGTLEQSHPVPAISLIETPTDTELKNAERIRLSHTITTYDRRLGTPGTSINKPFLARMTRYEYDAFQEWRNNQDAPSLPRGEKNPGMIGVPEVFSLNREAYKDLRTWRRRGSPVINIT